MITLDPKQQQAMTPEDERNAKIIGLLLVTAKMLGGVTRATQNRNSGLPSEGAGKYVVAFLEAAVGMYGDGPQLEKETLALAKELGFNVEQIYTSGVAHA